jgi:hypothetical protein
MFETGQWVWSVEHRQPGKVVEASALWDEVSYQVWLPGSESVIRATPDRLQAIEAVKGDASRIRYVLYAARIYSFRARRKSLQGIGLLEVREFRLRQLAREETAATEELKRQSRITPQLTPLLMLRIP